MNDLVAEEVEKLQVSMLEKVNKEIGELDEVRRIKNLQIRAHYMRELVNAEIKRIEEGAQNPQKHTETTLLQIIKANSETAYGKQHLFAYIDSLEMFKELHPLTRYQDYHLNENMVENELRIDFELGIEFFAIMLDQDARTGKINFIPVSDSDLEKVGLDLVMSEKVNEFCTQLRPGLASENVKTLLFMNSCELPGGTIEGPRESASAWIIQQLCLHVQHTWPYVAPAMAHLLTNDEDAIYLILLFGLRDRDVHVISGTFIPTILGVVDYLKAHWMSLVSDLRNGTISREFVDVSPQQLALFKAALKPNPVRADELELLTISEELRGTQLFLQKIWPNLCAITTISGGNFNVLIPKLREYINDDVIIVSPILVATKSRLWKHTSVLLPLIDHNYLEFVPEAMMSAESPDTVGVEELVEGENYELVITSFGGLYRYRTGGVITCKGFYFKLPVFDITG